STISFTATGGDIIFSSNIAGGAIQTNASEMDFNVLTGSVIFNFNNANEGAAIFAKASTINFVVTDGNIEFSSNTSVFTGGAIGATIDFATAKSAIMNFEATNILFNFNRAGADGGAISAYYGSKLDFTASGGNIEFNSNKTSERGGAIYAFESTMDFRTSGGSIIFDSNEAAKNYSDGGGAIFAYDSIMNFRASGGSIIFDSNKATGLYTGVGAIFAYGSIMDFRASGGNIEFNSNTAASGIGGVSLVESKMDFRVSDGSIIFNSNDMALGVYKSTMSFRVRNSGNIEFISNTGAATGGAIAANQSEMDFRVSGGSILFSLNNAGSDGGAIYANQSIIDFRALSGIIFDSNSATVKGGAIYAAAQAEMDFGVSSGDILFNLNNAADGGAIYAFTDSKMDFEVSNGNIIFSTNNANAGGAIYAASQSEMSFGVSNGDIIFSSNSSVSAGGAINALYDSLISFTAGRDIQFNLSVAGDGGAIYSNQSTMSFSADADILFSSNRADNNGGAVHAHQSIMSFNSGSDIVFSLNDAVNGGAIYALYDSIIDFTAAYGNIVFSSNSASIAGGAIAVAHSEMDFKVSSGNIIFSSNEATGINYGGGAINANDSIIDFSVSTGNIIFNLNNAVSDGGAVYALQSVMDFRVSSGNITFSSNEAIGGGAVYANQSTMTFSAENGEILFNSNTAGDSGGAIYTSAGSNITFDGAAKFTLNRAFKDGGALFSLANQTHVFVGTAIFSNNMAGEKGGAVYLGGNANIDFSSAKFEAIENMAGSGGFLYSTGEKEINLTWNDMIISGNYADYGGVLFGEYGTVFRFNGASTNMSMANSTAAYGGVIALGYNGGADFSNTILYANNNRAENGGFIHMYLATATFSEAHFTGNTAVSSGGAIYMGAGAQASVNNIILTGNEAGLSGGAVYMEGGAVLNITPTVNTLIDGNTAGGTPNSFHLEQGAQLNLGINSITMTIKDGITSTLGTMITKTGNGLLLLDTANNAIDGRLNIYGGIVRTGYEIGSGDIYFDNGKLNITDSITMFSNLYASTNTSIIDLDIDDTVLMNGIIGKNNSGYFEKNGAGKLIMSTGSSVDVYSTIINTGELEVLTNSFWSSQLTVSPDTVLSGTGRITGNVTNNGIVRPGQASGQPENMFGTLIINGKYTENGILDIRLNEGIAGSPILPANDKLIVNGPAEILSDSFIALDMKNGFEMHKKYNILESNGLEGVYEGILGAPSFDILLGHDDKNVFLYIKDVQTDYTSVPGLDHNNTEVAKIIDKITAGGDPDKINDISKIIGTMDSLDEAGKMSVMEEVAGSIYANALLASGQQTRQAYHRILDRRDSGYEGYNVWAGMYGSQSKAEQEFDGGDFKIRNGYLILGLEKYSDSSNFIMGYYLSAGQHDTHQRNDIVDINDYRGGLYLGKFIDKWAIRAELSGGYQQYEGQRRQTLLQSRAESSYDGWNINANVEAFYKVYESNAFNLSPFAGLDGSFIKTSGFKEKGYGNAAAVLTVKDNRFEIMNAIAGLRAEKEVGILRWYGELGGKYNLRGSKGDFKATLNNLNEEMTINGVAKNFLSGKAEAGFSADIWKQVEVFAMGSYERAERFYQVVGEIGLGYRFGGNNKKAEKPEEKEEVVTNNNNDDIQKAADKALEDADEKAKEEIEAFKEQEKSGGIQVVEIEDKPKAKVFRLNTVLFDFDKYDLTEEGAKAVAGLGRVLKEMEYGKISVEGHTDDIGTLEYNEELSMRRANTVYEGLKELGIDAEKMEKVGHGKIRPIATNETEEGRALNRRVEIVVE
ncbi:MAG: autotransporter domain-containing protein, partial [Endomicrobia bacterium]|nr:autotransporter domain-containing protein [Endomicrobiia bacterium]